MLSVVFVIVTARDRTKHDVFVRNKTARVTATVVHLGEAVSHGFWQRPKFEAPVFLTR